MIWFVHTLVSIALAMTSGVVSTTNAGRHAVRAGRRSYIAGVAKGRRLYSGAHSFGIAPGDNHRASRIIANLVAERTALATA